HLFRTDLRRGSVRCLPVASSCLRALSCRSGHSVALFLYQTLHTLVASDPWIRVGDRAGGRVDRSAGIIGPPHSAAYCRSHFLGGWLRCPLQLPGLRIRFADRVALYSPIMWYWQMAVDGACCHSC